MTTRHVTAALEQQLTTTPEGRLLLATLDAAQLAAVRKLVAKAARNAEQAAMLETD